MPGMIMAGHVRSLEEPTLRSAQDGAPGSNLVSRRERNSLKPSGTHCDLFSLFSVAEEIGQEQRPIILGLMSGGFCQTS